jgi:carbon monoxide dehydrogenase subunit G
VEIPCHQAWNALIDPGVLRRCTPGLEELYCEGPGRFRGSIEAKLPGVSGRFEGSMFVVEEDPPNQLRLRFDGESPNGALRGHLWLRFAEADESTQIRYEADFTASGLYGRIGEAALAGAARELALQFFDAVERRGRQAAVADAPPPLPRANALRRAIRWVLARSGRGPQA